MVTSCKQKLYFQAANLPITFFEVIFNNLVITLCRDYKVISNSSASISTKSDYQVIKNYFEIYHKLLLSMNLQRTLKALGGIGGVAKSACNKLSHLVFSHLQKHTKMVCKYNAAAWPC